MLSGVRTRYRTRDDAGFGLIEAVVALLLAGIVFGALATTLISAVQASLYGRQNQQAVDFMTRELERIRTADFGTLAHVPADLAGDPRLTACGSAQCLLVDGAYEPAVTAPVAGLPTHTTVLTSAETNNTDYTVSVYITETGQPVDQAVRATVYVTWQNRGETRERSTSTIVAFTQRGLPLPMFKLEVPSPTAEVNPGANIEYEVVLSNQGAPDSWNLSWAGAGAGAGWKFYADSDGDGDLDPLVDAHITNTGRLDPATEVCFFFMRTTSPAEALGSAPTTITASSVGQPGAAGAVKSVTVTSTVTTGAITVPGPTPTGPPPGTTEVTCAAGSVPSVTASHHTFSLKQYTLHNDGAGDSPLQAQMYMSASGPDETGLWNYSTDVDTDSGRLLAPTGGSLPSAGGALAVGDAATYADWAYQLPKKTRFDGTGIVRLWLDGSGSVPIKVVLYRGSTSGAGLTRTALVEQTVTADLSGCAGFQEVYVSLPDAAQQDVPANGWLGLRVVTAGSAPVRLGYDVPGDFPATLVIGVK